MPVGSSHGCSNGPVVALAMVGVLGLLVGAGFFAYTLGSQSVPSTLVAPKTPTPPPPSGPTLSTSTTPATTSSTSPNGGGGIPVGKPGPAEVTYRANGFSFGHASSWQTSSDSDGKPRARIQDAENNQISVYVFGGQQDARGKCRTETMALNLFVPGTTTELQELTIAGQPAPGFHHRGSKEAYALRCVLRGGEVYNLSYRALLADEQPVADAFATVTSTFAFV